MCEINCEYLLSVFFKIKNFKKSLCFHKIRVRHLYVLKLGSAFDLVSGDGLFKILPKIGCPPRLLNVIRSFHNDMKGTMVFDGTTSDSFSIQSGVMQGCVLVPTLFGIFFAVMLKHAFRNATEGIYLRTRSDGELFETHQTESQVQSPAEMPPRPIVLSNS